MAQHAVGVGQTNAVQVIVDAPLAVEPHGLIVIFRRYQQVEPGAAQNPFDRILPRLIGNTQRFVQRNNFVRGQIKFGPQ